MRWQLACLITLFLVSCATGSYRIADQNLSLAEIKKAVVSVIGEPRALSENQRTYLSQYFSRKPDPKFDPTKSKERLFAKVVILGDRRPYDVDVDVIIEERTGRSYEAVDRDLGESKRIGKELREKLHLGRDDRNVIDQFRAF